MEKIEMQNIKLEENNESMPLSNPNDITIIPGRKYYSCNPRIIIIYGISFCVLFSIIFGVFMIANNHVKSNTTTTFTLQLSPYMRENSCSYYNIDICLINIFLFCGIFASGLAIPFLASDRVMTFCCNKYRNAYDDL